MLLHAQQDFNLDIQEKIQQLGVDGRSVFNAYQHTTINNSEDKNVTHPSPVTGSQPGAAKKPVEKQLGLDPFVTSVKTSGWAYLQSVSQQLDQRRPNARQSLAQELTRVGFTKPRVLFPAAILSSLTLVKTAAQMGADKEVPPTRPQEPCARTTKESPMADTSGYPRPPIL